MKIFRTSYTLGELMDSHSVGSATDPLFHAQAREQIRCSTDPAWVRRQLAGKLPLAVVIAVWIVLGILISAGFFSFGMMGYLAWVAG
jgi:hypothetical protein